MVGWIKILVVAVAIASPIILLVYCLCRCYLSKQRVNFSSPPTTHVRTDHGLQSGIAKFHAEENLNIQSELDSKKGANYYVFRSEFSTKPVFNWADHPALITDAVENGWSRFGFAGYMSSPSTRSTIRGLCAAGDSGRQRGVEISWEVTQGSVDFMQKIRLNSGLKKMFVNFNNPNSMSASAVIKTALPLPGPPLGNSPFPQEAYFEITILTSQEDNDVDKGKIRGNKQEGEKTKLIQDKSNSRVNSESLVHITNVHGIDSKRLEDSMLVKEDKKDGSMMISFGLAVGGPLPLKLPGGYPGSIGFHSTGSVYLDGIRLVYESEKAEWGRTDQVIGCGYDPSQKKIFFTVDSELVHVIHCKAEEFSTPLYPTLAANTDVTVLVNFGQSSFIYAPANAHRTPNPCFIGPLVKSPTLGYEDSKELFSMGRIDSQWLNRPSTAENTLNNSSVNRNPEYDVESEGDLFEIVLDRCSRSPSIAL
ncbi:SPRY domain [Dillenia turbinata]|uniref:SPRY domain n=1 Tax=Dillenia turbinata TaxID=194707 RepID=A0AAN8W458_9MAGN